MQCNKVLQVIMVKYSDLFDITQLLCLYHKQRLWYHKLILNEVAEIYYSCLGALGHSENVTEIQRDISCPLYYLCLSTFSSTPIQLLFLQDKSFQ